MQNVLVLNESTHNTRFQQNGLSEQDAPASFGIALCIHLFRPDAIVIVVTYNLIWTGAL